MVRVEVYNDNVVAPHLVQCHGIYIEVIAAVCHVGGDELGCVHVHEVIVGDIAWSMVVVDHVFEVDKDMSVR